MKHLLFSFFIFYSCIAISQNFEGTLTYKNDLVLSKKLVEKTGLTVEKMKKNNSFFAYTEITYKQGNYCMEASNSRIKQIYNPERKELLTIDSKLDLVSAIITNIDLEFEKTGNLPKIEIVDTKEVILSHTCKKVVVTWQSGVYAYYYNSQFLPMDPNLYANHRYDMWFEFLKKSNALPLKIVKKTNGFMTATMTLEKVDAHAVKDKKFKLPKLKPHEDFVFEKGNQRYYKKD
ncbi:hypothetical protein FG167_14400 [Lacinutrix sp. WUR7]|uniref:hypothetical protein n=1 Tax=Lacinutrix sp. WUR7 TaxID=2653681 RepID=UPI00193DF719|nr:hypothetical protein [Lacinutrix sp. WUR7]QRM90376.1 hypothetical protein FG167_14400 [Lacinutrix sp. WUR7]